MSGDVDEKQLSLAGTVRIQLMNHSFITSTSQALRNCTI